jgi:sugar/nucleoside kinase (ribokinase family)
MHLLLIGHSVVDKIVSSNKSEIKPGGIYYSALGLSLLKQNHDHFKIITQQDEKSSKYFKYVYDSFDTELVQTVNEIPHVELTIFEYKEREEEYFNFASKLKIDSLKQDEVFDGILINMITGNDISADDLSNLKNIYKCKIYLDVHSLAKELDQKNKMRLRKIPNIENWLSSIDILQANQAELYSLRQEGNEMNIIEYVLSSGPELILITRANRGAEAFFIRENKIKSIYFKAIKSKVVNKVGCGDIFGAVFFYNFLKESNITRSLRKANIFAGISTQVTSETMMIEKLKKKKFD